MSYNFRTIFLDPDLWLVGDVTLKEICVFCEDYGSIAWWFRWYTPCYAWSLEFVSLWLDRLKYQPTFNWTHLSAVIFRKIELIHLFLGQHWDAGSVHHTIDSWDSWRCSIIKWAPSSLLLVVEDLCIIIWGYHQPITSQYSVVWKVF